MKWTDILKVIQIPKVNLNVKDLSNANKEPEDDKCRKELFAFTDKLDSIKFPMSPIKQHTQEIISADSIVWENNVNHYETTNFNWKGFPEVFEQSCKYEMYVNNRNKDGMQSSNIPEEVACRILELFDEHKNKKSFHIEEKIQGYEIDYYANDGVERPNSQNLYSYDKKDNNWEEVQEVRTAFYNHNLSVYNRKGLTILEIGIALWLINVLSSGPAGASELQYNKEAKELFMWFPNVRFNFIHHYVNIGNLFSYNKKGLLE